MISGVPDHVDGRMLGIAERPAARLINGDRMWHYVEGVHNWDADLDEACDPHSARAVLDVVRRDGQPAAGALHAGLRHDRHARSTS